MFFQWVRLVLDGELKSSQLSRKIVFCRGQAGCAHRVLGRGCEGNGVAMTGHLLFRYGGYVNQIAGGHRAGGKNGAVLPSGCFSEQNALSAFAFRPVLYLESAIQGTADNGLECPR